MYDLEINTIKLVTKSSRVNYCIYYFVSVHFFAVGLVFVSCISAVLIVTPKFHYSVFVSVKLHFTGAFIAEVALLYV